MIGAVKWWLVRRGIFKLWTVRCDYGRHPVVTLNWRWWALRRAWVYCQNWTPTRAITYVHFV